MLLNCRELVKRLDTPNLSHKNSGSKPPSLDATSINELKINKVPGKDAVIFSEETVHHIVEEIRETEKCPNDRVPSYFTIKVTGRTSTTTEDLSTANRRQVTLQVLPNRVEEKADHLIGKYEAGFSRGRSCAEQILSLILRT